MLTDKPKNREEALQRTLYLNQKLADYVQLCSEESKEENSLRAANFREEHANDEELMLTISGMHLLWRDHRRENGRDDSGRTF